MNFFFDHTRIWANPKTVWFILPKMCACVCSILHYSVSTIEVAFVDSNFRDRTGQELRSGGETMLRQLAKRLKRKEVCISGMSGGKESVGGDRQTELLSVGIIS